MATKRFVVKNGLDNSGNSSVANTIINVAEPVNNSDAATKYYVDTAVGNGLPSQTGSNGKFLTTNGTTASWSLVGVSAINATGTPSATTYLRGDGTWATVTSSGGTVTSVSVVTSNGVSGTVANSTTTPAITLTLGNITPTSVASSGAVSGTTATFTGNTYLATTSGNAGIGTTSPNFKLEVNGTMGVINNSAYFRKNQTDGTYTSAALWTESYGTTTTGIAFHISGVVGKFLEMRTNGTLYFDNNTILNSGNYTSYSPSLSGSGATGTWGIGISGNSSTATTLQTARLINGTSFNGSADITPTEWLHSNRDFTNGTLITTSIDCSGWAGDPFALQMKGNSYGSLIPFDIQLQGYIYNDTIINYGGYSTGPTFSIIAMNVGGKLCFWFARQAYWQGFNCFAYSAYGPRAINKVSSITDVVNPNGTKQVTFNPEQVLRSGNYSSYALPLTGGNISGTTKFINGTSLYFNGDSGSTSHGQIFDDGNFHIHSINGSPMWLNSPNGTGVYINRQATGSVYLCDGGSVGIGSTDIYEKLNVRGNTRIHTDNPYLLFRNGGYGTIWGSRIRVTDYGDGMGINFDTSDSSDNWGTRMVVRHNGNVGIANTSPSYKLDVSGTIRATNRIHSNEWIQFSNYTGLYSDYNNAYFYPNNGTYGTWRINGSRSGWNGIEFGANNGNVTLMIDPNSNGHGFYNPSYGWQVYWTGGTLYCFKNAYGGGTQATVLDSSNFSSYALPLAGGKLTGKLTTNYPTNYTAITSVTADVCPVRIDGDVSVGSSAGFLPAMGMTSVYASGYRQHLVIGNYRTASQWNGGMFVGLGGNDSYCTEYYLMSLGGGLTYVTSGSGTYTFLSSNNYSSYALPLSDVDVNATANKVVKRDASGHINAVYGFFSYLNTTGGNSENPTIGQIWTQNTTDNYCRKSTPAHFKNQMGMYTNGGSSTGNVITIASTTATGGSNGDIWLKY